PHSVILNAVKNQVGSWVIEFWGHLPLCHSERSEESRPTPPKYHLSFSHTPPQEKGNILVEDEILHCVQNDKDRLCCPYPALPFM
ncbi:MAG: hypothetical protein M3390_19855, partial [Chloroflexota bacterium]|nr:hypothetical protein [Chloroflexota bacterium]